MQSRVGPVRPVIGKGAPFAGSGAPLVREGRGGALAGKTVYLSAGHGWIYTNNAWRTQRGNTHALVEDFITVESVNEYLIRYLHAMGAYVVPIREADLNPNMVIVDDVDAIVEGEVAEIESGDAGWGSFETPFDNVGLQPFAQGGTRAMTASETETGRIVFPAAIAEPGFYNVYIAYPQAADHASDAHFIVRHAGGESHVRVDQRRHGSTWMLLGRWYFTSEAAVAVANDAQPGTTISLDAVRFGGGMGLQQIGGKTTGRPAFESAATSSTQLLGAPRDVYDYYADEGSDDVVARPRFAAWEHEAGEDAVYVAFHTNAPDPGRGTMSIAFGNKYPCCAGLSDFAGTAGSLELLHAVHDELLADIRADYDPNWRDAGKVTAALGELNPSHNGEMPAILVELAFHSTAADADALRDPAFRKLSARAMANGIAKYFAAKDGTPVVLPPETPTALRVENTGTRSLKISWRGDAPRYRVFLSDNGYGFDDGQLVDGESLVLDALPHHALRFVRVAAVNDGGESLPTEVVGARLSTSGDAPILVVGGFDRLDRFQMIREAAPLVGEIDRSRLDRMNDGTYAARHGRALADGGFAFDGATDEAVAERDVDLATYQAIDWFAGEQSNAGAFPETTRTELARFFTAGGHLLLNGSELVWALDSQGTERDKMWVRDVLHAQLGNDDAETYDVVALDGPFAGIAPFSFKDTASGGYDAKFPDVLVPGPGATPVLDYATGGAAAVAWEQGIVVGFPLELVGAEARTRLLSAAMRAFGVEPEPDHVDPPIEDPPAGCGCRSSSDAPVAFMFVLGVCVLSSRRRRAAARA